MKFRPCIDLHNGQVKQIVGSTLSDDAGGVEDKAAAAAVVAASAASAATVLENFSTDRPASDYALMYKRDGLAGGHVIMLGPGNERAAISALAAYPGGMQVGGGIDTSNAKLWLGRGASHVIVTSYVFRDGRVDYDRLGELVSEVGRERLVLDLSCRRRPPAAGGRGSGPGSGDPGPYYVVTDRWQNYTDVEVNGPTLAELGSYCSEFLVHGVENEGRRCGILEDLVCLLGEHSPVPVTYAGGVRGMEDLDGVRGLGGGKVDITMGSALDCFGGDIAYDDVVAWHKRQQHKH